MKPNLLKDWFITRTITGSIQLHGHIYNDSKGRFADGKAIVTSNLRNIDFETGVANTKNSTYNLDMGAFGI